MTDNLKVMLENENIYLNDNIYYDIEQGIDRNARHIHVSFLVNTKTNNVLSYGFNLYFKTKSFPFSIHSEVNTITRYYKNRTLSKCKKKLIVVKISKNGIIGMSKPCQTCINYILNNIDNINLTKIEYSTSNNKLEKIKCANINDHTYKLSALFEWRSNHRLVTETNVSRSNRKNSK